MPDQVGDRPIRTAAHVQRRVRTVRGGVEEIAVATDRCEEIHPLDIDRTGGTSGQLFPSRAASSGRAAYLRRRLVLPRVIRVTRLRRPAMKAPTTAAAAPAAAPTFPSGSDRRSGTESGLGYGAGDGGHSSGPVSVRGSSAAKS